VYFIAETRSCEYLCVTDTQKCSCKVTVNTLLFYVVDRYGWICFGLVAKAIHPYVSTTKSTTNPEESKVEEKKEVKLNPRQELFCKLYATDREFFGNGVQSYIEVYEPDQSKPNWYKSAQGSASRLLSNAIVYNRINELLEEGGLNDAFVDKQLLFLISQQSDFTNKATAIREYNKLKQRIVDRLDHTSKGKELSPLLVRFLGEETHENTPSDGDTK